jgi:pilus assembly protein CpaC
MKTAVLSSFTASLLLALFGSLPLAAQSAGTTQNAAYTGAARPSDSSVVGGPAVVLYAGQVQVLDMPNVSRIAVGNGRVLKAQVIDPGQVVLIGQAAGSTTLRVWAGGGTQYDYEVTVRNDEAARAARDIRDILADEPGLKVTQYDGHVLIEGDYTDPATSRKLDGIAKMYPQSVVSIVPDHKVQPAVPQEKMIYLDVRVVEVRKDALEQLGVQWGSTANGPSLSLRGKVVPSSPQSWSAAFGIVSNLTSILNILETNGDSWTLAEPRVSCKSGGDAKFVVGGEIPISVATGIGQVSVVYKQYGVILEFHPVADDNGNVSSKIVAEVSQPDPQFQNLGQGLTGVAFRENRTETSVSLKENETLVISGLLQNSGSRTVSGIPGAAELPILGALFRSKNFQNERTELVVMVTPRPASPESETSVTLAKRADERSGSINHLISSKMAE